MKFFAPLLATLACAAAARAEYLSEGWAPGKPTTAARAKPAATYVPNAEPAPAGAPVASAAGLLDFTRVLTWGPVVQLFEKAGVNITEKVAIARESSGQKYWDERIPLITDDNYGDVIVNETLSEEEENERVWFLIITSTGTRSDGISKLADSVFDSAFNTTQTKEDLPHVRWGRIDYLNVTALTTKWAVWQAPYLVVLKDRGQTLRFYRAANLRLKEDAMREFLLNKYWQNTQPWASDYAPGGDKEYIMDFFAHWLTKIYNVTVVLPKWLLFIISGGVASLVLNLLHRPSATKPAVVRPPPPVPAPVPIEPAAAPASPSGAKRTGAKQRKGKK